MEHRCVHAFVTAFIDLGSIVGELGKLLRSVIPTITDVTVKLKLPSLRVEGPPEKEKKNAETNYSTEAICGNVSYCTRNLLLMNKHTHKKNLKLLFIYSAV